jgi:uncharacterized protein YjbI with pentapeptide repeats
LHHHLPLPPGPDVLFSESSQTLHTVHHVQAVERLNWPKIQGLVATPCPHVSSDCNSALPHFASSSTRRVNFTPTNFTPTNFTPTNFTPTNLTPINLTPICWPRE